MKNFVRAKNLVCSLLALPALIIGASFHWFFIRKPGIVVFDERYTVPFAERMIDGHWLPYVDACSHRGPLLYWLAAIAQKLSGRFNWSGPRWLVATFGMLTLLAFVATGFAARVPLAGGVAALCFIELVYVIYEPSNAFGVLGENFAMTFGIVAVCLCAWALNSTERPRQRLGLVFASGFVGVLAGLTKQTALVCVAPIFLWVSMGSLSLPETGWKKRLVLPLTFSLGVFLPILLVLLRYAVAGELRTFWYWFYVYNADIYMDPVRNVTYRETLKVWFTDAPWQAFLVLSLSALGLSRAFFEIRSFPKDFPRAYTATGLESTLALLMLVSVASMIVAKRVWTSYLLAPLPYVALAIGIRLTAGLEQKAERGWLALAGPVLFGALLSIGVGVGSKVKLSSLVEERKNGGWAEATPEQMCDTLDLYSSSGESLFVWGFDGDLYVTCHRHPATRFLFLTLVAGTAPPAWQPPTPRRVARDSRRQIIEDLDKTRPPVILDMPAGIEGVSLKVVPELVQYLNRNYCPAPAAMTTDGRKAAIWVRNDRCPKPATPR